MAPLAPDGPGHLGVDEDRLRRLLGGPELTWLVQRVRHRMAREKPLAGTAALAAPTDAQRRAAEPVLDPQIAWNHYRFPPLRNGSRQNCETLDITIPESLSSESRAPLDLHLHARQA